MSFWPRPAALETETKPDNLDADTEQWWVWVTFVESVSRALRVSVIKNFVESSHDLVESSKRRFTRCVESLRVNGLQAWIKVESCKISHFSYVFFAVKLRPTGYEIVPDKLQNGAQCCFNTLDCR